MTGRQDKEPFDLEVATSDDRIRVISLQRNYGQTAAMSARMRRYEKGRKLNLSMDGSWQVDFDISRLLRQS